MLVSFNWLKEYVDVSNITPEELGEKFNLEGLEVETIQNLGEGVNHLVVGEVETCEPLEGSDHLKKTTVDVGDEILPIVCGAPNVEAGQKVVVARVGAWMPDGLHIRPSKLRGVESSGMICSRKELNLEDDGVDGIYVLDDDFETGQPFEVK